MQEALCSIGVNLRSSAAKYLVLVKRFLAHPESLGYSSASSSSCWGFAGEEMRYFSADQLPKSISRQRSPQKGKSGSPSFTLFPQMGHFQFIARPEL
jgi:hypothetical protein